MKRKREGCTEFRANEMWDKRIEEKQVSKLANLGIEKYKCPKLEVMSAKNEGSRR